MRALPSTSTIFAFSLSLCLCYRLQLKPLLPSRLVIWTPSPPKCVCSWRFVKFARRSCRQPRLGHMTLEQQEIPALSLPRALQPVSHPTRMEGLSRKETRAWTQRSRKVKGPKLKWKKLTKRRSRPCQKFQYGSTSRKGMGGIHSSTTNLLLTCSWIYIIIT